MGSSLLAEESQGDVNNQTKQGCVSPMNTGDTALKAAAPLDFPSQSSSVLALFLVPVDWLSFMEETWIRGTSHSGLVPKKLGVRYLKIQMSTCVSAGELQSSFSKYFSNSSLLNGWNQRDAQIQAGHPCNGSLQQQRGPACNLGCT